MDAYERHLWRLAFPVPKPKIDSSIEPNWGIDQRPRDNRRRVDRWGIRKRILAFRREQGWSQVQLSRVAGIGIATVGRAENARHKVSPTVWMRFARLEWIHSRPQPDLSAIRWDQD